MDRRSFIGSGIGAGFYATLLSDAKAAGTSRAPKLKIREVRAIRLRNGFNSRFVRVYTEEGLYGTGECVDSVGTEAIINTNFNVMLKGRDPLDIQGILADFWGYHKINLGGPPSVMFVHGQGGPYLTAVSGVEMALWDLAGKATRCAAACRSICMPPIRRSRKGFSPRPGHAPSRWVWIIPTTAGLSARAMSRTAPTTCT